MAADREERAPLLRDQEWQEGQEGKEGLNDVETPPTTEDEKRALAKTVFSRCLIFFLVTLAMNQMNITLVIAISESISKTNHEPLLMSGLMVGLVGLGGLFGLLPFTLYFQKRNFKLGFVVHALCALFGGLISLLGVEYQITPCIYIGRVILGFSDSVNTLSMFAIHTLAPRENKTFYLLLCNVMSGIGCASGPFLSSLLSKYADGTKNLHMHSNDGLPVCVTVAYAIIMLIAVIVWFPNDGQLIEAGLYDQTLNNKRPVEDIELSYDEQVKKGTITAVTVLFVTYTRTCIRFCWETGAMSVLMNTFDLRENAGYIVGGIIAILPLYSFLLSMLSRKYTDHQLLTVLETCELIGGFLLFRMSNTLTEFWICMFVLGSLLLYYNNTGQSGILSSVMLKCSVPNHKFLDPTSLLAIYNACAMIGVMSGPLISRGVLQVLYSQNALAATLFSLCAVQTTVIAIYFCTMKPKKSPPPVPEITGPTGSNGSEVSEVKKLA